MKNKNPKLTNNSQTTHTKHNKTLTNITQIYNKKEEIHNITETNKLSSIQFF